MKKIINNQRGVTLIETVAATAIIGIIMVTVLGALLYGQKMIVFTDEKNNAAAQAQELVDIIMAQLSATPTPTALSTDGATEMIGDFQDPKSFADPKRQYIIEEATVNKDVNEDTVAYFVYNVKVRVYYNNGESYVDLKAFTKKGGVGAGLL